MGQFFFFCNEEGLELTVLDNLDRTLGSSSALQAIDVEFGRTGKDFVYEKPSSGNSSVFVGFREIQGFNETLHRIVATANGTTRRGHAIVQALFEGHEIVIKAASLTPLDRHVTNPMRVDFHYC